jgi:hypothetical protein
MLNAGDKDLEFELPAAPAGMGWAKVIDTSLPSPQDINGLEGPTPLEVAAVIVPAHCITVIQCQDKRVK